MFEGSKSHLEQVNKTYAEHGHFAIKWGIYLIVTGMASIVHGLIPSLFKFTAPKNVMRVANMIKERNNPHELDHIQDHSTDAI